MEQAKSIRPLISIIMPVYNVEKYIDLTIKSVLNQDYKNYELILVDDGSTDNCPKKCDEYAQSFEQIRVIHKQNAGQGFARNTGMDNAIGDYLYFLDSDDTIQPNTLSSFVDLLNKFGDFDFIASAFQYVSEKNRMRCSKQYSEPTIFDSAKEIQNKFLKRQIVILAPGTFYNRKWIKEIGLRFKDVPYSEDLLFVWEALTNVRRCAYFNQAFYNYLRRSGSVMTSTKYEKIKDAYPYFKTFQSKIDKRDDMDKEAQQFMLTRWAIGIFHSAAKLCTFAEYSQLLDLCEGDRHIRNARKFPDFKIRLLVLPYLFSKKLYYSINRII